MSKWLPSPSQVSAETVATVLGAIAGAIIIANLPPLKSWLAKNYALPNLASGDAPAAPVVLG